MKTALYENHRILGAKFVEFGGWEMPLQYKGIIPEHLAVRTGVGIFDVSHMGRIVVEGEDAGSFLDYLSTNKVAAKSDYSATYTVWCNSSGGCIDDLIVYRKDTHHYFVIINASNRQKDLAHLKSYASGFHVEIKDRFQDDGILAIQGPKAKPLVEELFPSCRDLKQMQFKELEYHNHQIIVAGTGYTGAGGVEIYAPIDCIVELWELFLHNGRKIGIEPIGLGARDTLRLEMGYALYGHEINETIAPTESVSSWTVKFDKKDFLGKEALLKLQDNPGKRSEQGIVLMEPGIARENYEVFKEGKLIGKVTSGTHSPTLNQSIAIVLIEGVLQQGEIVDVQIRKNLCKAKVVKLPFL